MPRHISFQHTAEPLLDGTKTVTRRTGWKDLKPGTILQAVNKIRGLKAGEQREKYCELRVVSVTIEPLSALRKYPPGELAREGMPEMSAEDYITMFRRINRCEEDILITRIEFEKIDPPGIETEP